MLDDRLRIYKIIHFFFLCPLPSFVLEEAALAPPTGRDVLFSFIKRIRSKNTCNRGHEHLLKTECRGMFGQHSVHFSMKYLWLFVIFFYLQGSEIHEMQANKYHEITKVFIWKRKICLFSNKGRKSVNCRTEMIKMGMFHPCPMV